MATHARAETTRETLENARAVVKETPPPGAKATRAAIVEEANVVFRLNIEVFNELEGSAVGSALRLALSTLKEKLFG